MRRRDFIKSAGGLILLAGATPWPALLAAADAPPDADRPFNVLFLTADDMNGSMPGWMGNPLKPTPNMDAFAATAHRFTKNHDAAPICQPSRQAMLTGNIANPAHSQEIKRLQDILMNYMITTGDPELDHYKTILAGGVCDVETVRTGKRRKKNAGN